MNQEYWAVVRSNKLTLINKHIAIVRITKHTVV